MRSTDCEPPYWSTSPLEAAFDYSKNAPLLLVTGYQIPDGIRCIRASMLAAWLKKRGARNAAAFAAKAMDAAHAQVQYWAPRRRAPDSLRA